MKWSKTGLLLLGSVLVALVAFQTLQRQLSRTWYAVGTHPEIEAELRRSLEDQKRLAELDPAGEEAYRERHRELGQLAQRLQVVSLNRQALARRTESILLGLFAGVLVVGSLLYATRQRRQERRLVRLQRALGELAAGQGDVRVGEPAGGTIGRIASMVEETSRVMGRHRRRLAMLENLSAWQETARRLTHEMRTPLTAARLELARLADLHHGEDLERPREIGQVTDNLLRDLDELGRFAEAFSSFAKLRKPDCRPVELASFVREFTATFDAAWDNLSLVFDEDSPRDGLPTDSRVPADRDLVRQVLVNLCDNSALALHSAKGEVRFRIHRDDRPRREGKAASGALILDVSDDGPGLSREIQARLFEPYTTTKAVGEGMGLGLAISKKILLDHQGDLELLATSPAGTTFRLTLPLEPAAATAAENHREHGAGGTDEAATSSPPSGPTPSRRPRRLPTAQWIGESNR